MDSVEKGGRWNGRWRRYQECNHRTAGSVRAILQLQDQTVKMELFWKWINTFCDAFLCLDISRTKMKKTSLQSVCILSHNRPDGLMVMTQNIKQVHSLCVDSRPVCYIVHEIVCYIVSIVWCIIYYFSEVFSHQLTVISPIIQSHSSVP